MDFLPDEVKGTKYYQPCGNGYEKGIIDYLKWADDMIKKNK
jgi:replication-associated recombination protein RarA